VEEQAFSLPRRAVGVPPAVVWAHLAHTSLGWIFQTVSLLQELGFKLQKSDIKLLLTQENQAIIDRVFQNAGTISAALGSQYSGMVAGSSLARKCMAQCRAGFAL